MKIKMENRCNLHPAQANLWNDTLNGSPPVLFQETICALIRQLNMKVFLKFGTPGAAQKFAVVGVTDILNLDSLQESLVVHEFRVVQIDTPHYSGLYFTRPEAGPEIPGLFLAPRREIISLEPGILNQSAAEQPILELKEFGRANDLEYLVSLDYGTSLSLWNCMERLLGEMLDVHYLKLLAIKYKNSHREFVRYYRDYKDNQRVFQYDSNSYNSFIEVFSWIYYWEVKIMAALFMGQPVSIHDVGTNSAQFPLLLSGLKREELYGLDITEIWASDKGWTAESFAKKIISKNQEYKPINFLTIDLTVEFQQAPTTDVIIANDVLEHLPDDDTAFLVLKNLWNKTGRLLMVHVPFEAAPTPAWDHYICFNDQKIRDWARQLAGAELLSDGFGEAGQGPLTAYGYLILRK